MPQRHVLLVGASREAVERVAPMLLREEFQVLTTVACGTVAELVRDTPFDLIVVTFPLDDVSVEGLLDAVRSEGSSCRASGVLLLASSENLDAATRHVDRGANRAISADWTGARLWEAFSDLLEVAPRIDLRSLVHINVKLGEGVDEDVCRAVNVSSSGMLLEGPGAFRVGSDVRVTFRLPGDHRPVSARARVVRTSEIVEEDVLGFAVKFMTLEDDGSQRLASYLSRRISYPAPAEDDEGETPGA